jgi:acylphosphatase
MSVRHVVIRGRVQGVGYRAWTEDEALRHDLEGWVRNRRDGNVEAIFSGPDGVVETMIGACWRGPPAAHVDAVEVVEGGADLLALRRPGERFSVLSTAR